MKTQQQQLHVATPLRQSPALSKAAGTSVYLKLDSSQPTGSFKIRGIGHLCKTWAERGCERFVCCSGGNAGMAAAYSARELGVPATIVVPGVTPSPTVDRLRDEGAKVIVHGKSLDESIAYGQQLVANNPGWIFISPFDDPLICPSCVLPSDDEKVLVEPACGAALAAVYSGVVRRLQAEGKLVPRLGPVVVVVCGGNNISLEQLRRLKKQLGVV
ncbi:L-serine dehydratase/L-threonine deaminase-like [Etheostoma cragini]|uniref:L-serine dehydratase/L-threonine deaminase-like n=1 Tax=Etheostoma cragini TaxID=417921 RepID=UPI00155E2520|nr:L-serine dehydratase/L-threonine deaminase-like [Etheostoma cragini]